MSSMPTAIPKLTNIQKKVIEYPQSTVQKIYDLPRIPPWFVSDGSQKLYKALAGTLRLISLSLIPGYFDSCPEAIVLQKYSVLFSVLN